MKGTLYGIGLGPGSSELITLKAWRLLSTVEVIAYPQSPSGSSLARRIAAPFIPEDVTEVALSIPMDTQVEPAQKAYDAAAKTIAGYLANGRHVAFICNGDPFFYSTFMYLHERLKEDYEIEIVPGVTSLTAAAAASRRPLCARNDVVKVLPAPLDDETLKREIASGDAIVINKVGRHFARIRKLIDAMGLTGRAEVIENASSDYEVCRPLSRITEDDQPYFSTIIIYKGSQDW
ncbi:MAG TPA: precorrin-2 C(20)-methyltransferase [Rhizobiales bacterium]|nr:precorrin-2 C(20)-methyltransferase [Hyphomicrobiales bacterium]